MKWVWQLKKWPQFEFDASIIQKYENEFHKNIGILLGSVHHVDKGEWQQVQINILTQEALSTSSIEGEILKRDSVQSSIRKQLGLQNEKLKIMPNEEGIAELMVEVYQSFNKTLSNKTLFEWHKMITKGKRDLEAVGIYRKHKEPMQVVSGNMVHTKVFYEAPPSMQMKAEMQLFINWYNENIKNNSMPVLIFAGIVHLYFLMIHPFEDGNGRIGRALIEKAISQKINTPALNSIAKVIEQDKKKYYAQIQKCNDTLEINEWLVYFAETVLASQKYSIKLVEFLIAKSNFFITYKNALNSRQEKVILRIFKEGIEGFKGGLSSANYIKITKASTATATRDLQELVALKILTQTGENKYRRYFINIQTHTTPPF
jgi:Fic family protein